MVFHKFLKMSQGLLGSIVAFTLFCEYRPVVINSMPG